MHTHKQGAAATAGISSMRGRVSVCGGHRMHGQSLTYSPTDPLTILVPRNLWIAQFHAIRSRRSTDFEARSL